MKKVISMIVAIAMLVTMFSTVINLGTAFAAQDYEAALNYAVQATSERDGNYTGAIPAGVLGWAKYGYDNAVAQMESANVTTMATTAATGFTAQIESVSGKSGETITVPLNLVNVPSKGIMTCDLTISYDASKLEYVSGEAGSIVKNASTNFEINKESDGKLKVLFLDYSLGNDYISADGTLVKMNFKVKTSSATTATLSIDKGTFGDTDIKGVTASLVGGTLNLNGSTVTATPVPSIPTPAATTIGFAAEVSSVSGKSGDTITVPLRLLNVPSKGIMTCDLTISYDATKLEYVSGEAGSIVKNASTNFEINKESDGKLKVLFLDYSLGNDYISADGILVNMNFKVKTSSATTTTISIDKGTFGDTDIKGVTAKLINGVIALNSTGSVTPTAVITATPTKTATPVPVTATPTKTATPVPATPTPVKTATVTAFTAQIESVSGKSGETIAVPLNLLKVPSKGIMTCDLTIAYDASMLEYVSGEAGSIVKNASTNFEINKESDGKLKVLFLDYTLGNEYINTDGTLVTMNFKVKTSEAVSTVVNVSKGTFGDTDIKGVTADFIDGIISLNGGGTVVTPTKAPTPVPATPTPVKTATVTGFTAQIESVSGKSGETITVPVNLLKVPSKGIMTCDLTIAYDASKLEYVSGEAGSIVKNASTNFEINKESDGKLKVLFLDYTLGDEYISTDGTLVNMNFKVKTSEAVSTIISITKGTFGDSDIKGVTADFIDGIISLNGGGTIITPTPVKTAVPTPTKTVSVSGFTAQIESVSGNYGETITVPVNLLKVPSKGIMTCDLTILYDASKLEYVSGAAGSIVKNASENFEINKESDGKLKVLFLDYSLGNDYISTDGTLVSIQFKVKTSAAVSTIVNISKASFGDIDIKPVTASYIDGIISLNGGGTIVTPTPTKALTPTPVSTVAPTPTKPPVTSNLKVEFYNTNTQADSNSIYPKFRLTNTGSSAINLADLKLRYYFTIDGDKAQTFWCDWSPVGSSNVTGKFEKLSPSAKGADYYLEISFSSGAGTLAPNTPIEVQGRFAKNDWTNYNQADDYSFNSSATNYTTWDKVTAYLSGSLVWGVEPNGSVATPTPTKTPVVTVTPTKTPVVTVTPTPNPNAMTVTIGSAEGAPGQTVTVPVTLAKVPAKGVTTCDMTISYDSSILEYVDYQAGSIVKNASENLEINEVDGKIKVLFLDYSLGNDYISQDGLFVNLNFKIKSSAKAGASVAVAVSGKATFGDSDIKPITANIINGKVEVIDASATKLTIGKVTGKAGSEVTVPMTFEGIPEIGITTCDMTVVYDSSILEYVGYEAGSIVKKADENLEINKQADGTLRILFLDMSLENDYIGTDGVFANLKFKIKSSAAKGAVAEISKSGKATFGDRNINSISVTIINGSVTVGDVTDTTPTPTPPTTTTPTATIPVTVTPTPTAKPVDGLNLIIDTVEANPGASVAVPVKLSGVPSSGILTADFTIVYDSSKLEYISTDAGSIITNAKNNLDINKQEDGKIRVLFLDETVGDQLVKQDGVFLTLNFNVKSTAAVGSSAEVAVSGKATFGDKDINKVDVNIINGAVKVVKAADPNGLKLTIATVDAANGQEVIVPITLTNVPASGLMTSDMTIAYDATKLEYIGSTAGSIVLNPSTNLEIVKEADGKIKVLFLDYTIGDQLIKESGEFANLKFKVLGNEGLAEISITKITVGDSNIKNVDVTVVNGGVNIGEDTEGYTVSGYINPDFVATSTTAPIVNAGFKVELVGEGKSAVTDGNGYFEIKDVAAGTYTIKITKDNYLTREIADVQVSADKQLSTTAQPILVWAGDMIIDGAQDGAINLEDIMEICKSFNTTSSDDKYKEASDLNKDGAVNLEDVMIVAKHFNKVSSDY